MKLLDFVNNFRTFTDSDVDVYDDYTGDCYIAYTGTKLTEVGLEHFKDILDANILSEGEYLEKEIEDGTVFLYINNTSDPDARLNQLIEFFYSAAGWCSTELWDKYFYDED